MVWICRQKENIYALFEFLHNLGRCLFIFTGVLSALFSTFSNFITEHYKFLFGERSTNLLLSIWISDTLHSIAGCAFVQLVADRLLILDIGSLFFRAWQLLFMFVWAQVVSVAPSYFKAIPRIFPSMCESLDFCSWIALKGSIEPNDWVAAKNSHAFALLIYIA